MPTHIKKRHFCFLGNKGNLQGKRSKMKKYTKKNLVMAAVSSSAATAALVFGLTSAFGGVISANSTYSCDVNGDGTVNVMDLNVLKNVVLNSGKGDVQESVDRSKDEEIYADNYSGILNYYYEAFTVPDYDLTDGFGYNWLAPKVLGGNKAGNFVNTGFAFRDINGDDVPELIIGTIENKDTNTGSNLGVVYSYGKKYQSLDEVLESWDRNRYTLLENKNIVNEASNGALNFSLDHFKLDSDMKVKHISFVFAVPNDTNDGVDYYSNVDGITSKLVSVKLENYDYEKNAAELFEGAAKIEFTPLSSFKTSVPLKASEMKADSKADETFNLSETAGENILFTATEDIRMLRINSITLNQETSSTYKRLYRLDELKAGKTLAAGLPFAGDLSAYDISFIDSTGVMRSYTLSVSGKDGSLILSEENKPKQ
jgi:hypothetical protein